LAQLGEEEKKGKRVAGGEFPGNPVGRTWRRKLVSALSASRITLLNISGGGGEKKSTRKFIH